ncbi:MAG: response regulator [Bacteroidota bacterium]
MAEKQIHLLHIEDDSVDRMVVNKVLKKFSEITSNYHAQNGEEALDMLRGTNGHATLNPFPNVILLDVNMPRISGLEFLQELRSDEKLRHLMAFVFTTSNDDSDRQIAHRYNVAGYIIKPVDITLFESTFKTLVDYWKLIELS